MVYYPLATGMARKFARKKELQSDDYIGAAGLALTVGVHNAFKYLVDPQKLTTYLCGYIKRAIMDALMMDRPVPVPPQRVREFYSLGYLQDISSRPLNEDDIPLAWDSRIFNDLEDVCDELERKVAHLRVEGFNNREISNLLSLTYEQVRGIVGRLRKLAKAVIIGD